MTTGRPWLTPPHRRTLTEESAISDAVIEARGYFSLGRSDHTTLEDSRRRAKALLIPTWATKEDRYFPGLVIPMYSPTGERISCQWRPNVAVPDKRNPGKTIKYASPKGQPNHIDVHPWNTAKMIDPSVPLWITEGIKKADALTTAGRCVVALTGVYNWRSSLGTLGDWENVLLKGRVVVLCFDADAYTNRNVLQAMKRLGAWVRSKGASTVHYLVTPNQAGGKLVKGADDFLAAGGTIDQLEAACVTRLPEPAASDEFTDARLAETFADDVLAGEFRWATGLGWMAWDGRRWREVDDKVPLEQVRKYVLQQLHAAVDVDPHSPGVKGWTGVTSLSRMKSVLQLAAGHDGVYTPGSDFDRRPDLINTPTGVVDLTTGDLLDHDPDYLFTRMTATGYHPGAEHPDWTAALRALPAESAAWMQVRYGQGITGHMTPDDRLIVQQGGGENGKTTITTGIKAALGDYYLLISDRVLLANPGDHPTELMDLRGVRFGVIEETPEARRLNVPRLKKVVGTPQITARHIRQDSVTFDATHSLFLSTNYLPVVDETDHGTWRRLSVVEFPYTFRKPGDPLSGPKDRAGDPGLRDRLLADQDGQSEAVLSWLVDGAVQWYIAGRVMGDPPPIVEAATRAWRQESDVVLSYLDERVEFRPDVAVLTTDLLSDFNGFLRDHGHREWSDKLLTSRLRDHDELRHHHVEKRRTRLSRTTVSRPPTTNLFDRTAPPAQPFVWTGLAFAGGTLQQASATTDQVA